LLLIYYYWQAKKRAFNADETSSMSLPSTEPTPAARKQQKKVLIASPINSSMKQVELFIFYFTNLYNKVVDVEESVSNSFSTLLPGGSKQQNKVL